MDIKRIAAGICGAALLLCSAPAAGAAGTGTAARQADLDYLMELLNTKHPDFYTVHTREQVAEKKAAIESGLASMTDTEFAIALTELTAMGGDSHTRLNVGAALADKLHMLVMAPEQYDGKWLLTGTVKEYGDYVGQELAAINGHSLEDLLRVLMPMTGADNETMRLYEFGNLLYVTDILAHYGIVPDAAAKTVPVTVRDAQGTETTLDIPNVTQEEYGRMTEDDWVNRLTLRQTVPATERDRGAVYKLLDLGGGALYMQYNACREDPDQPMDEFAAEAGQKLRSGAYQKFIIDLRYNGGGSDGVLYPVVYQAQQFEARGGAVYALAGENTFSSALINTVQLKDIGATIVGTPTGGSVDHFGSVTVFTLPNTGLRGQYSNKFIDMGGYYEAARPYGIESFPPDIRVAQSFAGYLDGIDEPVQYILTHAPIRTVVRTTAKVSPARVVVNGQPAAVAAYEIAGNNYFRLRDLAMAFAPTKAAFSVDWDGDSRQVTIAGGVYTPVGGELAPLPAGEQTAVPATAGVFVEGMPLVVRAYEINGNHYFKLRDLCRVVGISVEWDGGARTITIDTDKPYMS